MPGCFKRLQGCWPVAPGLPCFGCQVAATWLPGCWVAGLLGCWQPGCWVSRFVGCWVAGLLQPGCPVAGNRWQPSNPATVGNRFGAARARAPQLLPLPMLCHRPRPPGFNRHSNGCGFVVKCSPLLDASCGKHNAPKRKAAWPSGPRRWLKAPFRKGMGSNSTAVTAACALSAPSPTRLPAAQTKLCPHIVCEKVWVEKVQTHSQQYAHAEPLHLAGHH